MKAQQISKMRLLTTKPQGAFSFVIKTVHLPIGRLLFCPLGVGWWSLGWHPKDSSVFRCSIPKTAQNLDWVGIATGCWAGQVASRKPECCLGSASYCPVPCHQLQLQGGRKWRQKTKNKGEKPSKVVTNQIYGWNSDGSRALATESTLWTTQGGRTKRTKDPCGQQQGNDSHGNHEQR